MGTHRAGFASLLCAENSYGMLQPACFHILVKNWLCERCLQDASTA